MGIGMETDDNYDGVHVLGAGAEEEYTSPVSLSLRERVKQIIYQWFHRTPVDPEKAERIRDLEAIDVFADEARERCAQGDYANENYWPVNPPRVVSKALSYLGKH